MHDVIKTRLKRKDERKTWKETPKREMVLKVFLWRHTWDFAYLPDVSASFTILLLKWSILIYLVSVHYSFLSVIRDPYSTIDIYLWAIYRQSVIFIYPKVY